jgi:hypothetical protein
MKDTGRAVIRLGALLSCCFLSDCNWIECAVLCEGFYSQGMTNPKTAMHITCGNFVQKGQLTAAERDQMSACVSDYTAKGFVLDKAR